MRALAILILGLGLIGCAQSNHAPRSDAKASGLISATGTVRYFDLEGGFYGIVADDSTHYDPVDLPASARRDGLRVRFTASEAAAGMSTHMWGKRIEIKSIEPLR
jgi:hypothetical protein